MFDSLLGRTAAKKSVGPKLAVFGLRYSARTKSEDDSGAFRDFFLVLPIVRELMLGFPVAVLPMLSKTKKVDSKATCNESYLRECAPPIALFP